MHAGYTLVNEPISARRLIHILIKLGRIAKSTNPQRTTAAAAPESQGQSNGNTDDLVRVYSFMSVQGTHDLCVLGSGRSSDASLRSLWLTERSATTN